MMFLNLSGLGLFLLLVMCHFYIDYRQGDFMALNKLKMKSLKLDKENELPWWTMVAHSATHGIPVMIFTRSVVLTLFIIIAHFLTDYKKNITLMSFTKDQLIHISALFIVSFVYVMIR